MTKIRTRPPCVQRKRGRHRRSSLSTSRWAYFSFFCHLSLLKWDMMNPGRSKSFQKAFSLLFCGFGSWLTLYDRSGQRRFYNYYAYRECCSILPTPNEKERKTAGQKQLCGKDFLEHDQSERNSVHKYQRQSSHPPECSAKLQRKPIRVLRSINTAPSLKHYPSLCADLDKPYFPGKFIYKASQLYHRPCW